MEFNKKKQALLYLDRNGFYFYQSGIPNILSMTFLPTSVKDLDVVDQKNIENQIQSFSAQAKLVPSTISIIISPNLIFEKVIAILDPEKQKEEVDKFISLVPFDSVASRIFPIPTGVKVIGLNDDLYLSIKTSFEKLGSTVNLVLPYQSLGADSALLHNFTPQNVETLLKKLDKLRDLNMLTNKDKEQIAQINTAKNTQESIKPKKNLRIYFMAGFFVVLLLILGYMLMTLK